MENRDDQLTTGVEETTMPEQLVEEAPVVEETTEAPVEEAPIEEASDEEFNNELSKELEPYAVSHFSSASVDVESIDQMILANQLKYLDSLIQAEEENNLVKVNAQDFLELPKDIQKEAFKHAEKAMYDRDYFVKNNLPNTLIKPIQILATIKVKRDEAKTKSWKVDYYVRIIERLRTFKSIKESKNISNQNLSFKFRIIISKNKIKSFFKGLLGSKY